MKTVRCKICHNEREIEDNIILSVCPACQIEMKKVEKNNCPDCNCPVHEEGCYDEKVEGKKFCSECLDYIIPVEAGEGLEFKRKIKEYKDGGGEW